MRPILDAVPSWARLAVLLGAWATPTLAGQVVVQPGGAVPTIGAALARARPGERILVKPGVYREQITISRPVVLEGEGWPELDAGGAQAITVTADHVTIRGLVVRNVAAHSVEDRAGIKLVRVRDCVIEDNRLRATYFGIYVAGSHGCRIARNRIEGTMAAEAVNGNAIHLWNDTAMTVLDNEVTGHRDGIYLEFNRDAVIRGNLSTGNQRYGLHFMFSDSCAYRENTFRRNGAGVAVMYSRAVRMVANRFEANWGAAAYGLLLKDITDSRVEGNTFRGNTVALWAEGSNRLVVGDNDFLGNGWAVKLMADATDNRFLGNRFEGNSFDVATNSRSNSSTFSRNYWDHYDGYDLDRDGFGDVPFRPVRLFSLVVERHPPSLILLRSFLVGLLDVAERVLPLLTPETLVDHQPLMRWPR